MGLARAGEDADPDRRTDERRHGRSPATMSSPVVPVSWGELFDKIAILEIKTHRLSAAEARGNAARELELLRRAAGRPG